MTNAHAWYTDEGSMVLRLDDVGLPCGRTAIDVVQPDDCNRNGFAYALEIPQELVVEGEIELAEHPDVLGDGYASDISGAGATEAEFPENQPFWAGRLKIEAVQDTCVSVVLDGVHSPILDTFSGQVLDGGVSIPLCEP